MPGKEDAFSHAPRRNQMRCKIREIQAAVPYKQSDEKSLLQATPTIFFHPLLTLRLNTSAPLSLVLPMLRALDAELPEMALSSLIRRTGFASNAPVP